MGSDFQDYWKTKGPCLLPPCPFSLSFRARALGKATCHIGNSPVETPGWMSPTPSQQGPEARQQLLETAWKRLSTPSRGWEPASHPVALRAAKPSCTCILDPQELTEIVKGWRLKMLNFGVT